MVSVSSRPAPAPEPPAPKRVRHRDWSGATLGLGLGLFGLILGRLGVLWIRFDVFSQASVQFALLAVACALGIFMPRHKSLFAALFFVIFIVLYGLWPLLATGGTEGALQQGETRLQVAQYNLHGAHANTTEALAAIRALNPDVLTLAEVEPANQPLLDALKPDWPYQYVCGPQPECDNALVSKFPLQDMEGKGFWEGPTFVMARLGPDHGNVTIVGVHTTRFPYARAQFVQVRALAQRLGQVHGPLLVMGDFNATPFSRITQSFAESLDLRRQTSLPTWPADRLLPQIAIDHIFTSEGIRALNRPRLGPSAGSDHFPIGMTLALPANSG